MNDFFAEQYQNTIETNVSDDVTKLMLPTDSQQFTVDHSNQQKVVNSSLVQEELLYLIPANPLLKPGSLLGRTSAWSREGDEEDMYGCSMKSARSYRLGQEIEELSIEYPVYREFDYLFSHKRFMDTTLMVMGERIEIFKSSLICSSTDKSQSTNKKEVVFKATHYIDVLDGGKKYFLKSNMFSGTEHSHAFNKEALIMKDKLDVELIKHLYKNAKLEDVIKPLSVLSK